MAEIDADQWAVGGEAGLGDVRQWGGADWLQVTLGLQLEGSR